MSNVERRKKERKADYRKKKREAKQKIDDKAVRKEVVESKEPNEQEKQKIDDKAVRKGESKAPTERSKEILNLKKKMKTLQKGKNRLSTKLSELTAGSKHISPHFIRKRAQRVKERSGQKQLTIL